MEFSSKLHLFVMRRDRNNFEVENTKESDHYDTFDVWNLEVCWKTLFL